MFFSLRFVTVALPLASHFSLLYIVVHTALKDPASILFDFCLNPYVHTLYLAVFWMLFCCIANVFFTTGTGEQTPICFVPSQQYCTPLFYS